MKQFVNGTKRYGTPQERHQALRQYQHLFRAQRNEYKQHRTGVLVDFILSRRCQVFKLLHKHDRYQPGMSPVTQDRWTEFLHGHSGTQHATSATSLARTSAQYCQGW